MPRCCKRRAIRSGHSNARLNRGLGRHLVCKKFLDGLGNVVVLIRTLERRRLSRKGHAQRLIAQGCDDSFAPFERRFLDESGQIGDALRSSKSADRTHGLFPVRGVDPGADRMRDDQTREKN